MFQLLECSLIILLGFMLANRLIIAAVVTSSISQGSHVINEASSTVEVCVELEGLIEREVSIFLFTQENSATGI